MKPVTHANQIGATLAARRKELALSQTEVAGRLGLSQNRLSELESRPETMTTEQLLALLNVLGLEMSIAQRAPSPANKAEW
ncbi:MAG: helix-turn-helix transcriptional regulator [Pseudomonadota bacterium]